MRLSPDEYPVTVGESIVVYTTELMTPQDVIDEGHITQNLFNGGYVYQVSAFGLKMVELNVNEPQKWVFIPWQSIVRIETRRDYRPALTREISRAST